MGARRRLHQRPVGQRPQPGVTAAPDLERGARPREHAVDLPDSPRLVPGVGHERLLVESNHLGSQARSGAVLRVEVRLREPARRLRGGTLIGLRDVIDPGRQGAVTGRRHHRVVASRHVGLALRARLAGGGLLEQHAHCGAELRACGIAPGWRAHLGRAERSLVAHGHLPARQASRARVGQVEVVYADVGSERLWIEPAHQLLEVGRLGCGSKAPRVQHRQPHVQALGGPGELHRVGRRRQAEAGQPPGLEARDHAREVAGVRLQEAGAEQSRARQLRRVVQERGEVGVLGIHLRMRPRPRLVQVRQLPRGVADAEHREPGAVGGERVALAILDHHQHEPRDQPLAARPSRSEEPRQVRGPKLDAREHVGRVVCGPVGRVDADHLAGREPHHRARPAHRHRVGFLLAGRDHRHVDARHGAAGDARAVGLVADRPRQTSADVGQVAQVGAHPISSAS